MLRVKDAVTFRVLGVRQHGTWPGTVGKHLHPIHLPSQHNGMKEHELLEDSSAGAAAQTPKEDMGWGAWPSSALPFLHRVSKARQVPQDLLVWWGLR